MPIQRMEREAVPYVRQAYEPDTRTLRDLLMMAGQARAQHAGRRGQVQAQGWMTLGDIIGGGIQQYQDRRDRTAAMQAAALRQQQEDEFKRGDQAIRAAEVGARIGEREEAGQLRRDNAARQAREDAQKFGDARANAIGYGPMAESDVETVMQSPSRGGDVRYAFGPGTAEGPELMPTQPQRRQMEVEKSINAMGGQIGPNGQVVMPPKPEREPNPTEASLAMLAARGDQAAGRALERLRALRAPQQNPNGEPLEPVMGPDGFAIYAPRSKAVGQRVPTTREQPTEDERKTAGFYKQMQDAITILDELENQLSEKDLYQIQTLPQEALMGMANRGQMSDAAKRYLRAFEQFTEARMRPVSGAAISDSEFARDRRTYARQFGETAALANDRKSARQSALESLRTRAARALPKDNGQPPPSSRVRMQAPDGSMQEVDPSMVDHYSKLGAKVVK